MKARSQSFSTPKKHSNRGRAQKPARKQLETMTPIAQDKELKIRRAKSVDAPRIAVLSGQLGYPATAAQARKCWPPLKSGRANTVARACRSARTSFASARTISTNATATSITKRRNPSASRCNVGSFAKSRSLASLGMTARGLFQKAAMNTRMRASGGIYRSTIYCRNGERYHHRRVPGAGRTAIPDSQVCPRRRLRGESGWPRAAAISSIAGASRAPRGRGSDHPHAGGAPGAEASQRGGTDRQAGGPWLRAPEPQPGRPQARPSDAAAAGREAARTGGARPHRRVARERRRTGKRHQRAAGKRPSAGGQEEMTENRNWKIENGK